MSSWELDRHDWSKLEAAGDARLIRRGIERLASARDEREATEASHLIENNAYLPDLLYPASVPTISCLLTVLPRCSPAARDAALDLLGMLGCMNGADPALLAACRREIARGAAIYFSFLERGIQQFTCVDLLGLSAIGDPSLLERVEWTFRRLLLEKVIPDDLRRMTQNTLESLRD